MDRSEFYRTSQINDDELLLSLTQDDDLFERILSRTDDDDKYELIFDDLLDDQLTNQDNIDGEWVNLMTAGPLSVNYIGNLLVLASKRDFPLARPPYFVFQHIKDPSSFRATLAQVSGALYSALLNAHTAMDRIQLNVQQVPGHIKTALKLILAGSPKIIELMLPRTLNSIARIANESAAHARTTFDKFVSLQELIAETIQASTSTHSNQTSIVQNIQNQIQQAKKEQEQFTANSDSIKSQYDDARREVEKAREEYLAAYNAIPNVRGKLSKAFRKIVQAVVHIVMAPLQVLGCILGICYYDQSALNAALETARNNAIAKANELLKVLKEAEERQAVLAQQYALELNKVNVLIQTIAALDLEKMSEQEIVDILVECIQQMHQIQVQWGRLIQFFSKLSTQTDSTQQVIVNEFIAIIKEAQEQNILLDSGDRELFVEVISITSQEIERGAHLLYVMSKTYYDISAEYMFNQILNMNTLLHIQTDTERKAYLNAISGNMTATTTKVIELAQGRHHEYVRRNRARREEYEQFLQEIAMEDLQVFIG